MDVNKVKWKIIVSVYSSGKYLTINTYFVIQFVTNIEELRRF